MIGKRRRRARKAGHAWICGYPPKKNGNIKKEEKVQTDSGDTV